MRKTSINVVEQRFVPGSYVVENNKSCPNIVAVHVPPTNEKKEAKKTDDTDSRCN